MKLSDQDKIDLLRELTAGAPDCFASFGLTNRVGQGRWGPVYSTLTDQTLRLHLQGIVEIGTYPVIPVERGWPRVKWICADFDGKRPDTDWKRDVMRALEFLAEHDGCPAFVNLSRSGQGAHIRMLFRESVPAWLARRWLTSWLIEAEIMPGPHEDEFDEFERLPQSFDRLIPPQDSLSNDLTPEGYRRPGNLAGAPLHAGHARSHSGTLPLDPMKAALGNFEPDGRHWEHVVAALEARAWGEQELLDALDDCPDEPSKEPPDAGYEVINGSVRRTLPVVPGDDRELEYVQGFCEFFKHMRESHLQPYHLWMALATQLHRFGDEGHRLFHEISSLDPRYSPSDCDKKWAQTRDMRPVRCDTLARKMSWTCPLLRQPACNGCKAPTYFAQHTDAQIL